MSVYAMNNPCPYRASVSGPSPEPAPPLPPRPQQENNLLKVFSSLFESGKYSDLVIKCQGQRWKAHRAVVCTQSRPLAAAIDGNFRESATGEIDLEEDDPQIIGFMLEYFYKGDVSIDANIGTSKNPIDLESTPQSSSSPPSVQSGQQLYDLFGNPPHTSTNIASPWVGQNPVQNPLQNQVQNAIPYSSYGYWPNPNQATNSSFSSVPILSYPSTRNAVAGLFNFQSEQPSVDVPPAPVTPAVNSQTLVTLAAIYVVAEKYDVQPLKVLAKTKYESILPTAWNTEHFVESLELIYDGLPEMSEPDSLRDLAIKTAAAHAKELMEREDFMDLCKERGDFVTDVFKASLHQSQAQAAPAQDLGSGIPRCKINSSHAVSGLYAYRGYGGPLEQRYGCAVCNLFID